MDSGMIACTLEGAGFEERAAAWREVASRATARSLEQGRVVATYPADPELLGRVRALIAAEASCCSFFRFELREGREEFVIDLRYPDEARALVEGMLGRLAS